MKTRPAFIFQLSAFILLFGLTGCGTVRALQQPFLRTTNAVPVILTVPAQTNTTARLVEPTTNTVGNVVTITPAYVTNYVTLTPAAYVTNWATNISVAVNPALASALATLETANKFNPTPSAPLVDLALAGLGAGLAFYARMKGKQATAALAEGRENLSIARTVMLGVEEAKSDDTKAAIAKLSHAVGNAPQLNALVQKFTRT